MLSFSLDKQHRCVLVCDGKNEEIDIEMSRQTHTKKERRDLCAEFIRTLFELAWLTNVHTSSNIKMSQLTHKHPSKHGE